ncbi:MAG: PEP-CTERM sorting domain-containing protein [Rhodospirillales bacterium]
MFRSCLLLGLAAPLWATSITGAFDISEKSNFADILGEGFAWQFHQGNAGEIFTACAGTVCSLDGSAAPATFALLRPENWFRAVDGATAAEGNLSPGEVTGSIGGWFSWHVERTDWGDLPSGDPLAIVVPMELTGLLTAVDAQGNLFMEKMLSGTGRFETTAVRTDTGVTFFGAAGRFEGNVAGKNAPAQDFVDPTAGFVSESGSTSTAGPSVIGSGFAGFAPSGAVAADPGVESADPAPEPTAFILLGIGLAVVAALRRRFA